MSPHRDKRNILLIVEGENSEPRLIRQLMGKLGLGEDYTAVPYGTNVHELIEHIEREYDNDYDALDIKRLLADLDPSRKQFLRKPFTDIILIFDFDAQDDRFNAAQLRSFMEAFSDSTDTDKGKLLINYPMLESFKDFRDLGETSFFDKKVSVSELANPGYKRRVAELPPKFNNIEDVSALDFVDIIAMNTSKVQHLVDGYAIGQTLLRTNAANLSAACRALDLIKLYDHQLQLFNREHSVWVCCTCLFFVCDNWPSRVDSIWKKCRARR